MVLAHNVTLRNAMLAVSLYMILQVLLFGVGLWFFPMYLAHLCHVYIQSHTKNLTTIKKAFIGGFYGVVFGVWFLPLSVLVYQVSPIAYLIADVPYSIILAVSNFLTILWLSERINAQIRFLTHF